MHRAAAMLQRGQQPVISEADSLRKRVQERGRVPQWVDAALRRGDYQRVEKWLTR
ncbi:hypothetical protein ACHFJ9_12460 [Vibrio sp. D3]|uniref:hypothetical protein n=1 Tax=Vibrio sp. D3 TaxID=3374281 RepID=UPI003756FFAA